MAEPTPARAATLLGTMQLSEDRFAQLVEEAVAGLPEWVLGSLDNVEVFIDDEPPDDRSLLGLYEGVPLSSRGGNYSGALPDRITLFAGPIWRESGGDEAKLRAIVQHTVAHEIAHHFGIDDDRLHEIDAY
jgi:predicted Zn-dependent protease with MMP-like domain